MGTAGSILWVCPSTNPLTFASTSAFQGQYHHAHLPDKETKSWTSQLASEHTASLTRTFRLFLLPREEEGRSMRGKGSEPELVESSRKKGVTSGNQPRCWLRTRPKQVVPWGRCSHLGGPRGLLCTYPNDASRAPSMSGNL